jgi:tol-pal system protein YbgF
MKRAALHVLLCAALLAVTAEAAARSFVLSPFAVNAPEGYARLSDSVPGAMAEKLHHPVIMEARQSPTRVASQADARAALYTANADFAVWGGVVIKDSECIVQVHCMDKDWKIWSKFAKGHVGGLPAMVQALSSALGSEVFGLADDTPARPAPTDGTAGDWKQAFFTPPQFKYGKADAPAADTPALTLLSEKPAAQPVAPGLPPVEAPAAGLPVTQPRRAAPEGEEAAYKAALRPAMAGRSAEGISRFQEFQRQYPDGRYAPNAVYWIGECLWDQGRYKEALEQFRRISADYPKHHKNADALLKTALCLSRLGDRAGASQAYRTLLATFPDSEAAGRVRSRGNVAAR